MVGASGAAAESGRIMVPKVDTKSNSVAVKLDEAVFPRPVGLAAAYRFLDRCYVLLERLPKQQLHVRLKGKEPLSAPALEALAGEFGNELLHQLLRHQVSERTESLRTIIAGRALVSADTALSGADAAAAAPHDPLDFRDDPLGIAVPWEEKFGEQSKGQRNKKR
jgi:His-Xaa-Ser system protein HxsD